MALLQRRRTYFLLFAVCFILLTLYYQTHVFEKRPALLDDTNEETTVSRPKLAPWPKLNPSSVLLVTAYYPNISSVPDAHISNTLSLNTPLYIFTNRENVAHLSSFRGTHRPTIFDTSVPSPLEIKNLTLAARRFDAQFAADHSGTVSREQGAALYALGSAKVWFVDAALTRLPLKVASEPGYAFWMDIGALGGDSHALDVWPDSKRVEKVWQDPTWREGKDARVFVPVVGLLKPSLRFWNEGIGSISTSFISSTFFGGPVPAIRNLATRFYRAHYSLLMGNTFVGRTDTVFNTLALAHAQPYIALPLPADTPLPWEDAAPTLPGGCGARPWMYMFASEAEREAMKGSEWRRAWMSVRGWWGWRECQLGDGAGAMIGVLDVLETVFGKWHSPGATWEI